LTGTYAFGAISSALYQRTATGQGQMIDVTMLESMLSLTLSELQNSQFHVPPIPRQIFGPVECKDGYIMLAVASERTFQNMAIASGHRDWIEDPRFKLYSTRRNNWGDLIDELETWSKELPTAEVQAAFDRNQVPSSPYRTVKEAMADPQLAHRQSLATIKDGGGEFLALNPPFRMTGSDTATQPFVNALGADSAAVLAELGYSEGEIAGLVESGVTAGS
jgi:crotonobetainyl-CoA:carnitine CoA-transferase CaiB-like acyl-CoA transferase